MTTLFYRTMGPWDHGTMGPSDHGTMGLWDYRTMGILSCVRPKGLMFAPVYILAPLSHVHRSPDQKTTAAFPIRMSLVPLSYGPIVLWSYGPMVPLSPCPLVPWSYGPLVPWSYGPLVPWSYGPMVLWSYGPLVPWSYGPMVPSFMPMLRERVYFSLESRLIKSLF
jgi:hypothetical protein